jgi:hypothetical protein
MARRQAQERQIRDGCVGKKPNVLPHRKFVRSCVLCAKQGVLGCDVGKKKMRACYCYCQKMCGKCLARLGAQDERRKRVEDG